MEETSSWIPSGATRYFPKGAWRSALGLAICCLVGLGLGLRYKWLTSSIVNRATAGPTWAERTAAYDPKIGDIQDLGGLVDLRGLPKKASRPGSATCMLFLWHCDECGVTEQVRALRQLDSEQPKVEICVVVVRGQGSDVTRFVEDNSLKGNVVAIDRDAKLARRLNAFFTRRVYLFDSERRLLYISPFGVDTKLIWQRVRQELTGSA
jgi:hypothetical protein